MSDHGKAERDKVIAELSKAAAGQGRLIELGWLALRMLVISPSASEVQLREMRFAFFSGAQHLFASILAVMDEDREPTPDDLKKMDLIDKELKAWVAEAAERVRKGNT